MTPRVATTRFVAISVASPGGVGANEAIASSAAAGLHGDGVVANAGLEIGEEEGRSA